LMLNGKWYTFVFSAATTANIKIDADNIILDSIVLLRNSFSCVFCRRVLPPRPNQDAFLVFTSAGAGV
jgi:hypothetical protein